MNEQFIMLAKQTWNTMQDDSLSAGMKLKVIDMLVMKWRPDFTSSECNSLVMEILNMFLNVAPLAGMVPTAKQFKKIALFLENNLS